LESSKAENWLSVRFHLLPNLNSDFDERIKDVVPVKKCFDG
jgi:hypothetical protein